MADHAPDPQLDRNALSTSTFVTMLDALVGDFDVIDVMTELTSRCVELLDVAAAGILLGDEAGHLRVVGASNEQIQLLELFQVQNDQGPCLDCYTDGQPVAAPDLSAPTPWPKFAALSVAAGYLSVYATPLHRHNLTLGCLNLFMSNAGPLAARDVELAQALADVASIAIVQSDVSRRAEDRYVHLVHAFDSRITVEQAKGMLAERFTVDVHDAFEMLRTHARANGSTLTSTANQLVAGSISVDAFGGTVPRPDAPMLTVVTSVRPQGRTVRIAGELDLATKDKCFDACVNGDESNVDVDIGGLTFMDCSGYGALIAAQVELERRGGSMKLMRAAGEPARLLDLVAQQQRTKLRRFRTVSKTSTPLLDHGQPTSSRRKLTEAVRTSWRLLRRMTRR